MVVWQGAMENLELRLNEKMRDEFWKNKKVLVTGHTGFKGSWLGLLLSVLGAKVSGLGQEPVGEPTLFKQLKLQERLQNHHIADICDFKALSKVVKSCKPEVVIHLAAQPLVRQSYKDPLGTWATNVQGTMNLLESLKALDESCSVVMVTTDKVYENREWDYGYRENDRLGGHDPYSASKAAAELAVASWRSSFCGKEKHQTPHLAIATARAGNVIGGGDWATDRIVPDAVRALARGRNIKSTKPTSNTSLAACVRTIKRLSTTRGKIEVAREKLRTNITMHLISTYAGSKQNSKGTSRRDDKTLEWKLGRYIW